MSSGLAREALLKPDASAEHATLRKTAIALSRDAAPSVLDSQFVFDAPRQALLVHFSGNVSASLGTSDLLLINLTTAQTVPVTNLSLAYDATTNTATFTFPGYSNGVLPDGDYRATFLASGITDGLGTRLVADYVTGFFFLQGDANHDRAVDVTDLGVLATNWQQTSRTFSTGDFTYDGVVDVSDLGLFATNWQKTLPAPPPFVRHDYAVNGTSDSIATADFNGDGRADLVSSSYSAGSLSVLFNAGAGTFGAPMPIPLPIAPDSATTADLNGDNKADIVAVSFDASRVAVLLGKGDGTFQAPVTYAAADGVRAAVVADFNADDKPDLALANSVSPTLTILRGNGDGSFQAPLNAPMSITPVDVVVGDFNKDGKPDLATADFFTDQIGILIGNGNATFQMALTFSTGIGTGPTAITAADFNSDGNLDLVTSDFLSNEASVLRGNGDGSFGPADRFAAGAGATHVVAADVNGDSKLDLAVADANSDSLTILAGDGTGSFQPPNSMVIGPTPRWIVAAQLDTDGLIDLAIANQGTNAISVLIN